MTDYEIRLGTSLNDDEEKPVKSSGPVLGSAQSETEADSERSSGETVENRLRPTRQRRSSSLPKNRLRRLG